MSLRPFISLALTTTASRFAGTAVLALALLFTSCSSASDTPPVATAAGEVGADNAAIDALFAEFDRPGSPGCGLAVAQDGELVYSRGYGYANLDHDIPNI